MTEEYYLKKPCNSDEEAVRLLTDKWRLFGGRMNPGLLRQFTGNYTEWMEYIDDQSAGKNIGDEVPQTLFFLKNSNGTKGKLNERCVVVFQAVIPGRAEIPDDLQRSVTDVLEYLGHVQE